MIIMLLLLSCLSIVSVSGVDKVWQWSNDFSNPHHWEAGRVPCPGQAVSIPREVVFMPSQANIGKVNIAIGWEFKIFAQMQI